MNEWERGETPRILSRISEIAIQDRILAKIGGRCDSGDDRIEKEREKERDENGEERKREEKCKRARNGYCEPRYADW